MCRFSEVPEKALANCLGQQQPDRCVPNAHGEAPGNPASMPRSGATISESCSLSGSRAKSLDHTGKAMPSDRRHCPQLLYLVPRGWGGCCFATGRPSRGAVPPPTTLFPSLLSFRSHHNGHRLSAAFLLSFLINLIQPCFSRRRRANGRW